VDDADHEQDGDENSQFEEGAQGKLARGMRNLGDGFWLSGHLFRSADVADRGR
jgi:hypothetical protein